jgi:hypothetical protein
VARRLKAWTLLVAFSLCITLSRAAGAHDPFEITTQGTIDSESLVLRITMARASAQRLVGVEQRGASPSDAESPMRDESRLIAAAARFYDVTLAGRPLPCHGQAVTRTPENDVEFRVSCDKPLPGSLRLHATYLERVQDGYSNAVTLQQERPLINFGVRFLDRDNPTLEVRVAEDDLAGSEPAKGSREQLGRFFRLGIHHLFTGYDHLLFLAGLLIGVQRLAAVLAIVTCFTLAHSITLALASLGVYALPDALVEPLIAASIMCVALDNLYPSHAIRWRLLITATFGLIHGFGFAGVFRDLELGGSQLVIGLLAFNVGIEVGQVAIAAPVAFVVAELRKRDRIGPRELRAASVAIGILGMYWFLQRVV